MLIKRKSCDFQKDILKKESRKVKKNKTNENTERFGK